MVVRDVVDVLGRDRYPGSAMSCGLYQYWKAHTHEQYIYLHTSISDLELVAIKVSKILQLPYLSVSYIDFFSFKPATYVVVRLPMHKTVHQYVVVTHEKTKHFYDVDYICNEVVQLPVDIFEIAPTRTNIANYKAQCNVKVHYLSKLESYVTRYAPKKDALLVIDLSRYLLVAYYVIATRNRI